MKNVTVSSAGTSAAEGMFASLNALRALAHFSIDASGHRSRRLTPEVLAHADIVIAMTSSHLKQIQYMTEKTGIKTSAYLLGSFASDNVDIYDPFGGGEQIYQDCFFQIRNFVLQLYKHVKSLNNIRN